MKISDRGRITIPKNFRDCFGFNKNAEVEFVPTEEALLTQKRTREKHPVHAVFGILNRPSSTDQYLEEVRGR
jgi:bifunctional DNA-binding transcriptional regulator/antitoxin component of YhaV-PrlF toxin-antitoxin module